MRALCQTLLAVHATVRPSLFVGQGFDKTVFEGLESFFVICGIFLWEWQYVVVYRLVVVGEVARDIYAIGARHTVGASGARHGGDAYHGIGNLL